MDENQFYSCEMRLQSVPDRRSEQSFHIVMEI